MLYIILRVSFRIFIKGGGGKRDNCRAKGGGEDYINTSNAISLATNIIELIDFLKLWGPGGMLPRKIFNISNL